MIATIHQEFFDLRQVSCLVEQSQKAALTIADIRRGDELMGAA